MSQLPAWMGQVRTDNPNAKLDRTRLITRAVNSGCPALISITVAYFPDLQERAAIKEFDAGMSRLDAELSTLMDELDEISTQDRKQHHEPEDTQGSHRKPLIPEPA